MTHHRIRSLPEKPARRSCTYRTSPTPHCTVNLSIYGARLAARLRLGTALGVAAGHDLLGLPRRPARGAWNGHTIQPINSRSRAHTRNSSAGPRELEAAWLYAADAHAPRRPTPPSCSRPGVMA